MITIADPRAHDAAIWAITMGGIRTYWAGISNNLVAIARHTL